MAMDSNTFLSKTAVTILAIFDEIWDRKGAFFSVFFLMVILTYGVLFAIDFIPEKPGTTVVTEVPKEAPPAPVVVAEVPAPRPQVAPLPNRLTIDKLGTDVDVLNPESREIADLDEALLSGVVRHPDSADFMDEGTMVLFGHSSYLPVVHNQNYKAFNGLQNLTWGDTITVTSDDMTYTYRVQKVYKAKASEAEVALDHDSAKLILITCNTFASKDDRFVVEADLIDKKPL